MSNGIKLFISHSSTDGDLAARLTELVRAALNLPVSAIRCTSVDGYRLPGGADTNEQLRREVHEAEAFIGIVSDNSLRSLYVLFELGARWGARKHLLPLLSPGTDAAILSGPIAGLNALRADKRAQLQQLVTDLGTVLSITPQPPASYETHITSVLAISPVQSSQAAPKIHIGFLEKRPALSLSDPARTLLIQAAESRDGRLLRLRTMQGLAVQANGKNLVTDRAPRAEAMWESAIKELSDAGFIQDVGYKREVFEVTQAGYDAADQLRAQES